MDPKKDTLPSLLDHPQYAAAATKLVELQLGLNMLETRSKALQSELDAAASNAPRGGGDAVDAAARRLLGIDAGGSPSGRAVELREAIVEVFEKRQVLTAAIRIQREVLAKQHDEVSRTCIAQVLPKYRELVRNIVACLKTLDLAQQAEHELRQSLFLRDIKFGDLRPMPVPKLGRLDDGSSLITGYLFEAYEFGFIELDEIPKHLHGLARAKAAKPVKQAKAVTVAISADDWLAS